MDYHSVIPRVRHKQYKNQIFLEKFKENAKSHQQMIQFFPSEALPREPLFSRHSGTQAFFPVVSKAEGLYNSGHKPDLYP